MECIDELATQITEMNFGADTYIHQGKDNFIFRDDAQDFYNEKYDEYEELINNLKL
jgi:hypothetical protein